MPEVAGEAALLVDPKDPKDIGKAMQQIASDANLRQELVKKGKLRLKRFSWDKTAEIIYSKLQELVYKEH